MNETFHGRSIVLAAAGVDVIAIDDNIFTIKDTKLFVPVATLSAKHYHKLSKLLSKRFKRSVYLNEDKKKNLKKKLRQMSRDLFLNQTL